MVFRDKTPLWGLLGGWIFHWLIVPPIEIGKMVYGHLFLYFNFYSSQLYIIFFSHQPCPRFECIKVCVCVCVSVPWPGSSVGWSVVPYTKRWEIWSLVRTHTSVAGSIPRRDAYRRQLINVSLSHWYYSLSLPSLLSKINKNISSGCICGCICTYTSLINYVLQEIFIIC